MNEVLAFDTHGLITNLTENGFAVRQAEALAKEIKNLLKNLATKTDLAQAEAALKTDLAQVEAALKTDIANMALKTDLARVETTLKADIARVEAATKADLAQVETTLKADIARVETTLKADLKAGLAMVEGKIDRTKYEIIKWMAGLIVGAVGATSALIVSLINFL